MVWDYGTFEALSKTPAKELAGGKLHFLLNGTKLQGEWYLVRLRDEQQWLLIRGGEDMPPVSKKLDDTSALSGKSMEELAKGDRIWRSGKGPQAPSPKRKSAASAPLPGFIEPMKALIVESPPPGDWIYEIKFDGFRAIALRGGHETRLLSRNEKDFGAKFPEVTASHLRTAGQGCHHRWGNCCTRRKRSFIISVAAGLRTWTGTTADLLLCVRSCAPRRKGSLRASCD